MSLLPKRARLRKLTWCSRATASFRAGELSRSFTDRKVRRRVGSDAPELVPCERNGRAPVEQMLTGKLTAETQRAMAEAALLLKDGGGAMVPGPGTF